VPASAQGHALAEPFLVAGSCLACVRVRVRVRCGVSLTFAQRRRDTPSLGTVTDIAMTKSYGVVTIQHVLPGVEHVLRLCRVGSPTCPRHEIRLCRRSP